jgi:hypothetical protein
MMSSEQHWWDFYAVPNLWTGILWILQQAIEMAFILETLIRSEDTIT